MEAREHHKQLLELRERDDLRMRVAAVDSVDGLVSALVQCQQVLAQQQFKGECEVAQTFERDHLEPGSCTLGYEARLFLHARGSDVVLYSRLCILAPSALHRPSSFAMLASRRRVNISTVIDDYTDNLVNGIVYVR